LSPTLLINKDKTIAFTVGFVYADEMIVAGQEEASGVEVARNKIIAVVWLVFHIHFDY